MSLSFQRVSCCREEAAVFWRRPADENVCFDKAAAGIQQQQMLDLLLIGLLQKQTNKQSCIGKVKDGKSRGRQAETPRLRASHT